MGFDPPDPRGIERATLVGNVSTCLPVALVAAQQPERVHGVVLTAPWVLASRTVHDLVAGSGLGFVSRGEQELKGVPGSWELFAAGRDAQPAGGSAPSPARPRAGDRMVMEVSRRAPGALRALNRLGNAAQRRRFGRR